MASGRRIPGKLKRIAEIRSKKARLDVAHAAKDVRDTQDDLEALDAAQVASEARLVAARPQLDGASLQLLGLGREVYANEREGTVEELGQRETRLGDRRDVQRRRMKELRGKERLYDHHLALDKGELEGREQEELDDVTGAVTAREPQER